MAQIPLGIKHERRLIVTSEMAIDFLGVDRARVLSTPCLVGLLEMACRDLVKPLLDEGFDTVGAEVSVKHLAATPVGMEIRLGCEVIAVDGRRLRFKVEAFDEADRICEGEHERFVIDVARFAARVEAKARENAREKHA